VENIIYQLNIFSARFCREMCISPDDDSKESKQKLLSN